MSLNIKQSGLKYIWITVLFLIIDQVTKHWVAGTFSKGEIVNILPFFNLTYVHNPGAAFSFLADQDGWQRWFLSAIAFAASVLFTYWLAKAPATDKRLNIAFALMLSGALGNLIDRVLFGYVIDFLDFFVGSYSWPAFNIADSAIFCGAALMLIDAFFADRENKQQTTDKENT